MINSNADLEIYEIISLAQQAHEYLTLTFKEIILDSESQRVSEVFKNLHDQAETQWHMLVSDTNLFSDI